MGSAASRLCMLQLAILLRFALSRLRAVQSGESIKKAAPK